MRDESEDIEVISIYFGELNTSADFAQPIGQEQITSPIHCLGFIEDGEILGYAVQKKWLFYFKKLRRNRW